MKTNNRLVTKCAAATGDSADCADVFTLGPLYSNINKELKDTLPIVLNEARIRRLKLKKQTAKVRGKLLQERRNLARLRKTHKAVLAFYKEHRKK
jgi:hypothetical protein